MLEISPIRQRRSYKEKGIQQFRQVTGIVSGEGIRRVNVEEERRNSRWQLPSGNRQGEGINGDRIRNEDCVYRNPVYGRVKTNKG